MQTIGVIELMDSMELNVLVLVLNTFFGSFVLQQTAIGNLMLNSSLLIFAFFPTKKRANECLICAKIASLTVALIRKQAERLPNNGGKLSQVVAHLFA